jgi:hypothetical protein
MYFADVRAQPCKEPAWFCHTVGTWNDGISKGRITLWPHHLRYLNANEGLWKLKNFTMQKYNLQKNHLKQTKILQDIITL